MKRLVVLGVTAGLIGGLARPARADVEYRIDLGEREGHRANIEMSVRSAPSPLELAVPVWTPGAYELRTWGRNVTMLGATDGAGRPLTFRRNGPSSFRVEGHPAGGEVKLRYRVYAPLLSDDASQVDARHAYLNGTSVFLSARGTERTQHHVHVAAPAGWRVASALDETPSGDLEALGYEALVDAPIEVGKFADAELRANGRPYRIAIDGATEVPLGLLKDVAAIAEAEAKLVGAPPYRRYLLLIHLADGIGRVAALEHAASTSIVVPRRSLAGGDPYDELLYVIAHELFHAWNARRLRPSELVPYDLSRPQTARSLWITEGLTEYYAHRAMHLAGKWSRARYFDRLGEEATRAVNAAAHGLSIEEDAELAWTPPDEAGPDPDAYYARGHLVALALDASMRAATDGHHTLDEVLRALLAQADRAGGVLPVDGDVLARAVAQLSSADLAAKLLSWTRLPHEPERMDAALSALGLKLVTEQSPLRSFAGFAVEPDGATLRVAAVLPDGPAAHAGLRVGDRILTADGAQPSRKWVDSLSLRAPGAQVAIEAVRATRHIAIALQLEAQHAVNCRLLETSAPPRIAILRDAWLAR